MNKLSGYANNYFKSQVQGHVKFVTDAKVLEFTTVQCLKLQFDTKIINVPTTVIEAYSG